MLSNKGYDENAMLLGRTNCFFALNTGDLNLIESSGAVHSAVPELEEDSSFVP